MKNKVALITGAAKRIGASIARHLHRCNYDIILHYHHSENEVEKLAEELNSNRQDSVFSICADLSDTEQYKILIETALEEKQEIDALINNASLFYPTDLTTLTAESCHELINVNLLAPLFLSQHAAIALEKNHGCIINMVDIYGVKPLIDYSIYSISKAALIMLTKSLAKELAPKIRVNAIAPGAIIWPEDITPEQKDRILEKTVLKRQGHLHDINHAISFLLEDADYITGEILTIDGGRSLLI